MFRERASKLCPNSAQSVHNHLPPFSQSESSNAAHSSDEDQIVQRELLQQKEMVKLKREITEKALHIIRNVFPMKVIQLSQQLDAKPFNLDVAEVRRPLVLSTDKQAAADGEPRPKKRKLDESTSTLVGHNNSIVRSTETIESNHVRILAYQRYFLWIFLFLNLIINHCFYTCLHSLCW